jgi:hypothetical protein
MGKFHPDVIRSIFGDIEGDYETQDKMESAIWEAPTISRVFHKNWSLASNAEVVAEGQRRGYWKAIRGSAGKVRVFVR